jgi:transcriptional regulator with XRE-family HTH domain
MDELIILGRVLRNLRLERNMSQFMVAQRSGVNLSYYCKVEHGRTNPSVRVIYAILRSLGVSPVQFTEMLALEKHYLLVCSDSARPA